MVAKEYSSDFLKALEIGRPPNIVKLFPHSRALIVSGKVIDRAMISKGKAVAIVANGRSYFVIRGALLAAQRARAAIIIEIAKSEGGQKAYCGINFWNIARTVDALCNELGITVPVAIHADHYGIKNDKELAQAKVEIPTLFEAGMTSIAIDASHLPDDKNLFSNVTLNPLIPRWTGYETEVGEIKGAEGLSTVQEALFLIGGLNARDIFPDWIALNNGTTHGIEEKDSGIQVQLTAEIHKALSKYKISGAQHGTSGNSSERLRQIVQKTSTTKANVATALQMISWGVQVNDYGNAILDAKGNFNKVKGHGVAEDMWQEMVAYAESKGYKKGDYKNLNLPFENRFLAQPAQIRDQMARGVDEFIFKMITEVLNSQDTAPLGIEAILKAGSYDLGPKVSRIENPAEWTDSKIAEKAARLNADKGSTGKHDD